MIRSALNNLNGTMKFCSACEIFSGNVSRISQIEVRRHFSRVEPLVFILKGFWKCSHWIIYRRVLVNFSTNQLREAHTKYIFDEMWFSVICKMVNGLVNNKYSKNLGIFLNSFFFS